jgi:hypothetical protein
MAKRAGSVFRLPEMVFVLLLVHTFLLLAALTRVMHRLWPDIEPRAGVNLYEVVPVSASLALAATLALAYAGAVLLLYERSRFAWWYCVALGVADIFFVPHDDHRDWVVGAAILVLLAVPRVRREVKG